MTRSEALWRHPERHLQRTLRPVAGDSGAPCRVLVQKRPPQVPSNVRLQVLLSTVQYSIVHFQMWTHQVSKETNRQQAVLSQLMHRDPQGVSCFCRFCWSPNVLVLKIWPAFRQFVAIHNRMKLADSAGHSAFAQTARLQCRSSAAATFALKRALNHDESTPRACTRARPSWALPPTARPQQHH